MPYPVLPPDPPPVIRSVPGDLNADTIAISNHEVPEYASAEAIETFETFAVSSKLLTPLLANHPLVHQSETWADSLGEPLEIGLPTTEPSTPTQFAPQTADTRSQEDALGQTGVPTAEFAPTPSEPFSSAVPAAAFPELNSELYFATSALDSGGGTMQVAAEEDGTDAAPLPGSELLVPPLIPDASPPDEPSETLLETTPLDRPGDTPDSPLDNVPGTAPDAVPPPPAPVDPIAAQDVIELDADRQTYNEQQQVFQADGNVELRFRGAVLNSDRLFVNIPNRIAVAEGNAILTRGEQVLQGDRIEYNLVQNQGLIQNARGELFLPSIADDTAADAPSAGATEPLPPFQVIQGLPGLSFGLNTPNQLSGSARTQGQLSRLRYEADDIEFMGAVWQASNVRITNDPFSPPELELRSNRVTVTPLGPGRTEIRARNPRLVFDQGFSLPLLQERLVIDNRERNPGLFSIGFDERDRGGLFIERGFDFTIGNVGLLTLTPQILVQRGFDEGFGNLDSYGLIARLTANPTPTTAVRANAIFTTLDLGDFEDTFRGSLRVQQQVVANHTLSLEYSYRDRLFNGSLGFQNVQSSLGLVVTSPNVPLGNTGINLNYQAGVQLINANANNARLNDPDIIDLLNFNEDGSRDNNRIDLARYQVSAALNRFFPLWSGTPLPRTPDQGLRYTPEPVVPFLGLNIGARGVLSAYSNGETQSVFTGSIGISGQFGQFSRPFLDYTGFSLAYSYNAVGGETPFDFDRVNDIQVLSLGLTQQIYGPFRLGIRSTLYLESQTDRENDADTTFTLEYSRRTYSISVSYSPQRQSGAIGFRINDFNWVGDPGPFSTGLGAASELDGRRIPGD
ncbi:DUF3769 domain-containing protein [Thermocoleostomius sinensis]|uniref:DUF3769 domain-containing protein n=1 Tax=Thermocoleostomius sinensis A174 TaxID=2016057 RepID=A0A9E9C9F4_9CYAN|nr:DUF3769 domain-containing protein [Thermocoleostomius sinensis]WAL61518.1 DUF3769 domain-containing protein [Thermocoleostomius sinensis A174]